tara:strand:+ start:1614 stop:2189 length:576 start_codon:yes stop_codon:yes gene_type:complete
MKKFIQLFLFSILILISIYFYRNYLKPIPQSEEIVQIEENDSLTESESNLIKNLKYNVKFDDNSQYSITSEISELTYENGIEIVKMKKTTAIFIDENNIPLIIRSDYATYNNQNYNSSFSQNVTVEYVNHLVKSENLDLNFIENIITIYNNVVYEGMEGIIKTDNAKIDLITKNVEIFMNNSQSKVKVISK